jgi:hypothetical protein
MLGWGLIFRILIEFQEQETLRQQIVEMVEGEEGMFANIKESTSGVPNP